MLCRSTFTLTTLSSDEPAASSNCLRLARMCRVSLAVVPRTRSPVCGSTAARPQTKRKSPPLTSGDTARPKPPAASRSRGGATMTSRVGDIGLSFKHSRSRDDVELNLEARLDLCRPHRARRRPVRHVLPIDAIEHVVLDAVVDQGVHLHESIERGACRFQQQ